MRKNPIAQYFVDDYALYHKSISVLRLYTKQYFLDQDREGTAQIIISDLRRSVQLYEWEFEYRRRAYLDILKKLLRTMEKKGLLKKEKRGRSVFYRQNTITDQNVH